ncbi:MAG: RnfABCDGE type electron transport complex subunit D [Candidatus Merdivicinus sp.]
MLSDTKYRRQMIDTSITLLPLLFMAYYNYGARTLIMAAISIATAGIADYICLLFQGQKWWKRYDFSPFIIGLTYVLLLPASAPYWLVIFGSLFAILVVRHPFGGYYHTLFHPSLTAFAFVVICWNGLVTKYPEISQSLPLTPTVDVPVFDSPAYRLMLGGGMNVDFLDAMLGNFIGPMGTTCTLVLLCCGIYLIFRKTILWQIPVASLSLIAFFAWFFPRINGSRMVSLLMELTSGVLLFSILFIASMDNDEMETSAGKWIYGLMLGGIIVLFRQLSYIELVSPFAIIIMNTVDHRCDAYAATIGKLIRATLQKSKKWALLSANAVRHAAAAAGTYLSDRLNHWINNAGKGEK